MLTTKMVPLATLVALASVVIVVKQVSTVRNNWQLTSISNRNPMPAYAIRWQTSALLSHEYRN